MTEPPEDWRDVAAWETWWQQREPEWAQHFRSVGCGRYVAYVHAHLAAKRHPRVLFAGNGTSVEPWLHAHWGHRCVAVDVSKTASERLARRPRRDALARFYAAAFEVQRSERLRGSELTHVEADLGRARQRLREQARRGGGVEVCCADFFNHEPSGRFDLVVSRFAFQRFSAADRDDLARRFHRWLVPGGVLLLEGRFVPGVSADHDARHHFAEPLHAAGFLIHEETAERLWSEFGERRFKASRAGAAREAAVAAWNAEAREISRRSLEASRRQALLKTRGARVAVIELSNP